MGRSKYTVVIAVTKLLKAREEALRDKNLGKVGGMDPRNSYESFAGRYVEKVSAAIQASAGVQDWPAEPGGQTFPLTNVTIFDVPTWTWDVQVVARQGCHGGAAKLAVRNVAAEALARGREREVLPSGVRSPRTSVCALALSLCRRQELVLRGLAICIHGEFRL